RGSRGLGMCIRDSMKVYVEGKDDQLEEKDKMLPDLKEGDTVLSKDIEPEQHFTQPPPRYTCLLYTSDA
ncbi:hypothetical protein ACQ4LK_26065, partial [Bacillus pumilus]